MTDYKKESVNGMTNQNKTEQNRTEQKERQIKKQN